MTSPTTALARERLAVRLRPGSVSYTATRVVQPEEIDVRGTPMVVSPGMWVISQGGMVVEAISHQMFEKRYQPVETEGLVLRGDPRTQVERVLGFGTTDTPEHLVTALRRIASFKIGDIQVDFTPGQWAAIAHRAEKRGQSIETYLTALVTKIADDLLIS